MSSPSPRVVEAFWNISTLRPETAHPAHRFIFTNRLSEAQKSPSPGFVCPEYRPDGILFVAKNGAVSDKDVHARIDAEAARLWNQLAKANPAEREQAFARLMDFLTNASETWPIRQNLIQPLAEALRCEREFAFINLVGFRSKFDYRDQLRGVVEEAWWQYSRQLIDALQPSVIVPLGNEQGEWLSKLYSGPAQVTSRVRRHIGDRAKPKTFEEDARRIAAVVAAIRYRP